MEQMNRNTTRYYSKQVKRVNRLTASLAYLGPSNQIVLEMSILVKDYVICMVHTNG